jgi:hypothetical protein
MKLKLTKLVVAIVAISSIAWACSKNQKVVRQLDGEWKITEVKYNGVVDNVSDYSKERYIFEKCKVEKGACPGKLKSEDPTKGPISLDFTYSISEKGTKITINFNFFGIVSSDTGDIIEHSKKKFIWSVKDEDGDVLQTTIEKI